MNEPGVWRLPERRWQVACQQQASHSLIEPLGISPLLASLLWERGIQSVDQASEFLDPRLQSLQDPFLLTDLKRAAGRILQAIAAREKIVVYGDYDVDGVTSTALMVRVIKGLGGLVEPFLPHRMGEGYGLSLDALKRCVAGGTPGLLIAVDCGTTSVTEISWLAEIGIDVLVVDHHELPASLPASYAMVNPHRDGRWEYFSSVGLVFKLCHGILKLLPPESRTVDLKDYLDLVAVGTVADLVPLIGENRVIVRRGLEQLAHSKNPGLRALIRVAGIRGQPRAEDVSFRIGPRLNASGRMGDAIRSLELLLTDEDAVAMAISRELDGWNKERQTIEQSMLDEALELLQSQCHPDHDWAIVLGKRGWHVGVIGIVASRIQKTYHRPTIVIGFGEDGVGKGSGRSVEGFSLVEGLRACASHLLACGGHGMAAGLSIAESSLTPFRENFLERFRDHVSPEQLAPSLHLSGEFPSHAAGEEMFAEIDQLAPFGQHNPQPVFAFQDVRVQGRPKTFGKNHLKFEMEHPSESLDVVGFGMSGRALPNRPFSVAATLDWDDYRDRVMLRALDWK